MKILTTIGPETVKYKNLKYLLNKTDMVRINTSHNSIKWHKSTIKKIKKINPKSVILVDFPGVKPRTNNKNPRKIKKNQIISFKYGGKNLVDDILLTRPLPKNIKAKNFSIDDGKFYFKLISKKKNSIKGKALQNCVIKPKKGLNIPESIYDDKLQEKIYMKYFNLFSKSKIDSVGLSFVQNKKIIEKIKKKYPELNLVSKVENSEGLKNVEEISKSSDAIMIDRGDLSAEIGNDKLYNGINKISKFCKKFGRPLIMATENLESLYNQNIPSKNDIISLGHSMEVNSDMIMLSEETAISSKWKKIFNWLNNFINSTKKNRELKFSSEIFWNMTKHTKDFTLVLFSRHGLMFDKIFENNVNNKVVVFTDRIKTFNLSKYYKNTDSIFTKKFNNKNINKFYFDNIKQYKNRIFKKNDYAFLITISFPKKGTSANSISLIRKKDF
jgi:pyruvate kinase